MNIIYEMLKNNQKFDKSLALRLTFKTTSGPVNL